MMTPKLQFFIQASVRSIFNVSALGIISFEGSIDSLSICGYIFPQN